jgi:hypothetical protein
LDTSTPAFPAVPLKESERTRDLQNGGNRLFHAAPERAFIPKITLSAPSIKSISDKKSPQTLAGTLSLLQRISQ